MDESKKAIDPDDEPPEDVCLYLLKRGLPPYNLRTHANLLYS